MSLPTDIALPPTRAIQDTLMYHISRTFFDLLPVFERYMGMTRARWHLLIVLHAQEWTSQAQLTQHLRVDAAAVTRQVKQLEEEGLVTRRADPQDNRFTLVALTQTGRELYEGLRERRDTFEKSIIAGLSEEEMEQTKRCLSHIRENLFSIVYTDEPLNR